MSLMDQYQLPEEERGKGGGGGKSKSRVEKALEAKIQDRKGLFDSRKR